MTKIVQSKIILKKRLKSCQKGLHFLKKVVIK
jgi:hypothetical protein